MSDNPGRKVPFHLWSDQTLALRLKHFDEILGSSDTEWALERACVLAEMDRRLPPSPPTT